MTSEAIQTKICTKCNEDKKIDEFYYRKDNKKYRNECKLCYNLKISNNRKENPDYIREYLKEWRKSNPDYNIKYCKKWREENPGSFGRYYNNRIRLDSVFRVKESIRKSILSSFRFNSFSKRSKTSDILGCSFVEFKTYLESRFEPWMSWDNRGLYNGQLDYGWDLDHIIPISSAKSEEELIKLNHYTNFQPLCSKINRDIKKDNY